MGILKIEYYRKGLLVNVKSRKSQDKNGDFFMMRRIRKMYGKNVGNYVLTHIEHLHIIYIDVRHMQNAKCELAGISPEHC